MVQAHSIWFSPVRETKLFIRIFLMAHLLTCLGCLASGNFRSVSFNQDLSSGDLAYFRRRSRGQDEDKPLDNAYAGIPLFVPVVARSSQSRVEKIIPRGEKVEPEDGWPVAVHIEDHHGFLFWILGRWRTANFNSLGKLESNTINYQLAYGFIFSSETGLSIPAGGGEPQSTSSFELLYGFLGTYRGPAGRTWRIFWVPF